MEGQKFIIIILYATLHHPLDFFVNIHSIDIVIEIEAHDVINVVNNRRRCDSALLSCIVLLLGRAL